MAKYIACQEMGNKSKKNSGAFYLNEISKDPIVQSMWRYPQYLVASFDLGSKLLFISMC
jgi:hypothetical protein